MIDHSPNQPKLIRVSSKGQITIPTSIRKKLKINRTVLLIVEKGRIILQPVRPMEESFGEGRERARQAAIGISIDRRKEVEAERKAFKLITRPQEDS